MEIKNFFSKTELQKNGKLYDVFSLFNLIKIKRRKHLIYQGVESLFGKRRVLFVHFEFTSVCNRQCSYCLENNGNPNKIKEAWSDENKVLSAVEKIFALANETDFVFFIIAGGEPTLQPAFIKLVEKIKSYRNGGCLVTTNLTQSIEYYQQLDIPICTSLHLENNDVDQYLKKVKELKNLIAHVRLMAPPHMVPQIQVAFKKLKQLNQTDHISFAVERLYSFGDQIITYPPEELKEISKLGYYDAEYPESLKQKMGPAEDIFYRFFWFYKNNKKKEGTTCFKNFFCDRNLMVVLSSGEIKLAWCETPGLNIFSDDLPTNIFKTVVCSCDNCPMGFSGNLPKYARKKYSPLYNR